MLTPSRNSRAVEHVQCMSHRTQQLSKYETKIILSLYETFKSLTENWKYHVGKLPQNLLTIKTIKLILPTFISKTDSTTEKRLSNAKFFFLLLKFYNLLLREKVPLKCSKGQVNLGRTMQLSNN